jgi:glutamine amidotransferase-like uncharacterized protein
MKSIIGVYVDDGTSTATIIRSITQEAHPSYIVRAVVAEHLNNESFFDDVVLFVMPGGADLPYCEKLNGLKNGRLRRWVEAGGVYLGLCAGAYYGCAKLDFAGRDGVIAGKRELGFLKGTAVGSISDLAPLYDFSLKSAAVADLITNNGDPAAAFYHGGPFFEFEDDPKVKVLARYASVKNEPPAIIECAAGSGRAILSGVHPEVSYNELEVRIQSEGNHTERKTLGKLVSDLKKTEKKRRQLWRSMLMRCDIELNTDKK